MKIGYISDLHLDINNDYYTNFEEFGFFKQLKDLDILFIAGDICSNIYMFERFISSLDLYLQENNINTHIIFCLGNHEHYNKIFGSINDNIKHMLQNKHKIIFLDNDYIKYKDYIIYGTPLYTNFEYTKYDIEISKTLIPQYINDFRTILFKDNGNTRLIHPNDYVKLYNESIEKLHNLCKTNKDTQIIVLSHFAPHPKSISKQYENSDLNCFFVNDLEKFIKDNKNIKLWIHGHVHSQHNYKVGQCRIVCNSLGYIGFKTNVLPKEYKAKVIDIN